jgi:hypothetical protein
MSDSDDAGKWLLFFFFMECLSQKCVLLVPRGCQCLCTNKQVITTRTSGMPVSKVTCLSKGLGRLIVLPGPCPHVSSRSLFWGKDIQQSVASSRDIPDGRVILGSDQFVACRDDEQFDEFTLLLAHISEETGQALQLQQPPVQAKSRGMPDSIMCTRPHL